MSEQILKKSLDIINKDNELKSKDSQLSSSKSKSKLKNRLRKNKKAKKDSKNLRKEFEFTRKSKTSLIEQFKSQPERRRLQLEANKEKLKKMASLKVDKSLSKTLFKDFESNELNQVKKLKKSVFTEDDFLEFERQFVMN